MGDPNPCGLAEVVKVGTGMLSCSLRKISFGLAVVLYGVLQAHRRFTGPALAPLVSSLLIIVSYLVFDQTVRRRGPRPGGSHHSGTAGALARRDDRPPRDGVHRDRPGVRARSAPARPRCPSLRASPPGAGLASAGIAVLIAQQLALIIVVRLAEDLGGKGAVGVYTLPGPLY